MRGREGEAMTMAKNNLPEETSRGEETTLAQRKGSGLPATRRAMVQVDHEMLSRADRIVIDGLEVFANHGVYAAETELGQKFVVSATLFANLRPAAADDDLGASVDYGDVCHRIDSFLRLHTFKLIEAAAEALARDLLDAYPELLGVRIRLEKPWAPVGLPLKSVGVEIERTR